jgi:hypothetical protein
VTPDPKWLEILKASGWQTAALAVAFGLTLWLSASGGMPPLDAWAVQVLTLALTICALLTVASLASEVIKLFPIHVWLARELVRRREQRAVREYIPHMTPKEREIVGYLLSKNQKTFTCNQDGGYAATLISRGLIVRALRGGQVFDAFAMPAMVPDHVWQVLKENEDQFPSPSKDGKAPWYRATI